MLCMLVYLCCMLWVQTQFSATEKKKAEKKATKKPQMEQGTKGIKKPPRGKRGNKRKRKDIKVQRM